MREQAREWARPLRPAGNPSATIYGTIVAGAVVAAEGAGDTGIAAIVGTVLATLVVYWLAHVYADLLAPHEERERTGHPTGPAVRAALAAEWGVVAGGLGLVLVLVVADLAGAATGLAVNIALGCACAELAGWGAIAARQARLSTAWVLLYAAVSAVFGLAIVLLKVVLH